jgi:hypothetical protein
MNPNDIAPMVISVTLFIVTGAVILLWPVSRKLGALLEVMTHQKRHLPQGADAEPILHALAGIEERLAKLEERQSFAEALLASPEHARVQPPRPQPAER